MHRAGLGRLRSNPEAPAIIRRRLKSAGAAALVLIGFSAGGCSEPDGVTPAPARDGGADVVETSREVADTTAANDAPPESPPDIAGPPADGNARDSAVDSVVDSGGDRIGGQPDAPAGACPVSANFPGADQPWVGQFAGDIVQNLTALPERATAATRRLAREQLSQVLSQLGLVPMLHNYDTGTNLYAVLAATTGAGQQVVLGADFDTVAASPGANDNASGVAAVLAAARFLAQLECRSRSVMFVLFDQEEVGLLGSKAFASKLAADGTAIHSVHSVDQIGWDQNNDRLVELERPDPGLRLLYEAAMRKLNVTFPLVTTTTGSTDHVSFRPRFPAIGVTEGYASGDTTPHRHRATDRFATINLEYLRSTTVLVTQVVADLLR